MRRLMNFLRGMVILRLTGPFPERLINLCAQEGIDFWAMEWLDENTVRLTTRRHTLARLRELARKAGCEMEREASRGLPDFLGRFRTRYAFLVGLVFALCAVSVLSRFVLVIQVSGNQEIPSAVIFSHLPNLDSQERFSPELAQELLVRQEGLSWAALNLHGTRLEVIVREEIKPPERVDETGHFDIVAQADGVITHIEPELGDALVKDGDVVAKGETLISGVLDLKEPEGGTVDLGSLVVHAAGNVTARTWRTLEETIPLTSQVKEYTGEESRSWGLKILWFDLDFFENSSISSGRYDKITETAELTLFGRPMPAALTTVTRRGYTLREEPVDGEQAAKELEELLWFRLEELMAARKGEVLRTDFVTRQEDGRLTVTLLAECREEIGRTVEREGEVGRIYGTPQEDTKETG